MLDYLNEQLAPSVFPKENGGRVCPKCEQEALSIRLGKFGAFVGCSKYPECTYTRSLVAGEDEMSGETNSALAPTRVK